MPRSNLAPSVLGVLLGLLAVTLVTGVGSFLVLQQLSRSPQKPNFADVKKDAANSQLDIRSADDKTYLALVMYQGDLVLRDKPDSSGKVLDKLRFEETVTVIGESDNKRWQQVRFEEKGIEGWIQAGNVKRAQ
jgi:uncharacterized protein YgiM (DUF1202 family)